MDIEKFKELIEKTVSASLTEKEREKAFSDLNSVVTESSKKITELSSILDSKNLELEQANLAVSEKEEALTDSAKKIEEVSALLEEATAKIENMTALISQKDSEIEGLSATNTSLEEKASILENKLNELEKEAALTIRVKKLSDEKVLRQGKSGDSQKAKVKEMTEEEFSAYLEDLKELRKEILSSVKITRDNSDSNSNSNSNNASAGRMDFEAQASNDIMDKYKKLGEVLASKVKERLASE